MIYSDFPWSPVCLALGLHMCHPVEKNPGNAPAGIIKIIIIPPTQTVTSSDLCAGFMGLQVPGR